MTLPIQLTVEQLDYLIAIVDDRMVNPSGTPEYELLNKHQQNLVDKLYEGYKYDEEGNITR